MKRTLNELFKQPDSPITYDYNQAPTSPQAGLLGLDTVETIPQPATMIDLGQYWTPFAVLWRRGKNVLTGI